MKFSNRLNSVPPYPFAKLENLISTKRQQGIDLVSFGIGDPDLKPPEFINNALIDAFSIPGNHNYSSSSGEKTFRDSIAVWFEKRFNVVLNPDEEMVRQACSVREKLLEEAVRAHHESLSKAAHVEIS